MGPRALPLTLTEQNSISARPKKLGDSPKVALLSALAAARAALEAAERGEAGLDALLAVLEQDPATLETPPEGAGEDISNDVNYVKSTSPPAPPAPIDDSTLKGWPLRRNE